VQVNLSGESIGSPELLAVIEHELRETGAEPADIVFEITETAVMRDTKAAETFTHYLVKLGCGLALDDFGTGFGSFTHLKTLPVDYLKIDVEFVRDLGSNRANQHLVKAVVNLAHGFGKQTIAEAWRMNGRWSSCVSTASTSHRAITSAAPRRSACPRLRPRTRAAGEARPAGARPPRTGCAGTGSPSNPRPPRTPHA
jgi:predicted signal transduction protein with EAL and GGDEF domain